jgi:hypothetical protein
VPSSLPETPKLCATLTPPQTINFALEVKTIKPITSISQVLVVWLLLTVCSNSVLKKQYEMVVGNVIGSNLFNTIAVLAIPGLIHPSKVADEVIVRDYTGAECNHTQAND